MRIALFSGNYNYVRDGANQALNRLVGFLEEQCGHQVRVYSPTTATPAFAPRGTLISVPSVAVPGRGEFRLATGLNATIRADIAAFGPDLVHVSAPDILGTRAVSLGKSLGVPVVASLHTLFETYLEHYRLAWLRPLAEAHLRRFYRRCDHVLAPTPAIVAALRAMRGDSAASLWSRGVDHQLYNPERRDNAWRRDHGIADDEVAILFFGRLVLEKGIETYAATLRRLMESGAKVRPLIVGEGPARHIVADLPGAILTGHLDGVELARAVSSGDLFLHTSRSEAFGNVMLEAMASGVPIVAVESEAATAMFATSRNGLICGPQVDDCVAAARGLLDDARKRKALAAAGIEFSRAFSWDAASRHVADVYEGLLRTGTVGDVGEPRFRASCPTP